MKNKVITYLIGEKENLNNSIDELIYPSNCEYRPLSFHELELLEKYRRQIYEIYDLIDILNERTDLND